MSEQQIHRAEATVGGETIVATAYLHGATGDGSLVISDGRGEQLVTCNLRRLGALMAALYFVYEQITPASASSSPQPPTSTDLESQRDQLHTALEHILQAGDGLAKADAALQEYNAVHGDYSYTLNDAVDAALRRYTAAYAAARAALKLKGAE